MFTWLAGRILNFVDVLADTYYTRKYGALARRLGRPGLAPDRRRGFIILQIDGLSYDHLMQALDAGVMPYLARMLAEQRLVVSHWRCGLPSTTPAAQAGIMFGNRFDIPGFRWYEKERQLPVLTRRPDQAQAIRARVSQGRPGILRGGSCYVSVFDGDAELALFTLSALDRRHFFESARGLGLFLLFLLSPFRLLRVLWLIARGYLAGLGRRLIALVRPSVLNPFDVFSPLVHAASDVLFTEVQTFGVMLDISRCVPAIYANYNSYDEAAHKMGPDHRAAFRILRDVDKRIHQIDRMRRRYRRREYDLYVMADHGNTSAMPFRWRNGVSLGQYIISRIGEGLSLAEGSSVYAHSAEKMRYLLNEWQGLTRRFPPRLRRVFVKVRRCVGRRMWTARGLDYDLERQRDVVVSASGSLAHIYFNISPRPLDLTEVALLYPELLDALLATPGIGAVVGRVGDRTITLGPQGGVSVVEDGRETVEWPHPLMPFGEPAYTALQVHQLAHFPHSGDLVVLGALENGRVMAFEEQIATHGGLGGPQMRPFIASPPACPLEPELLNDPQDLYTYFLRRYLEQ